MDEQYILPEKSVSKSTSIKPIALKPAMLKNFTNDGMNCRNNIFE